MQTLSDIILQDPSTVTYYAKFDDPCDANGQLASTHLIDYSQNNLKIGLIHSGGLGAYELGHPQIGDTNNIGVALELSPYGTAANPSQLAAYIEVMPSLTARPFLSGVASDFTVEYLISYQPTPQTTDHTDEGSTQKVLFQQPGLFAITQEIINNSGGTRLFNFIPAFGNIASSSGTPLKAGDNHIAVKLKIVANADGTHTLNYYVFINGILYTSTGSTNNKTTSSITVNSIPAIPSGASTAPTYILGTPTSVHFKTPIRISHLAFHNRALSDYEIGQRVTYVYSFQKLLNVINANQGSGFSNQFINDKTDAVVGQASTRVGDVVITPTLPYDFSISGSTNHVKTNNGTLFIPAASTNFLHISFKVDSVGAVLTTNNTSYPNNGIEIQVDECNLSIYLSATYIIKANLSDHNLTFNSRMSVSIGTTNPDNGVYRFYVLLNGTLIHTSVVPLPASIQQIIAGKFSSSNKHPASVELFDIISTNSYITPGFASAIAGANKIYSVSGLTLDSGYPSAAIVRIYNSATGELTTTINSNSDGQYIAYLSSNAPVDIVVKIGAKYKYVSHVIPI